MVIILRWTNHIIFKAEGNPWMWQNISDQHNCLQTTFIATRRRKRTIQLAKFCCYSERNRTHTLNRSCTASFKSLHRLESPGIDLQATPKGYCTFCVDIGEHVGGMLCYRRPPVHHVDSSLLLFHLLSSFQRLDEVFILISSYHSSLVRKRENMSICHFRA